MNFLHIFLLIFITDLYGVQGQKEYFTRSNEMKADEEKDMKDYESSSEDENVEISKHDTKYQKYAKEKNQESENENTLNTNITTSPQNIQNNSERNSIKISTVEMKKSSKLAGKKVIRITLPETHRAAGKANSCDDSWTFFDEPISLMKDNSLKERKIGDWDGLKPRKGNLEDLLGNFCGMLPNCRSSTVTVSPWMGLLLRWDPEKIKYSSIRCGVTLISKTHAITSAKCVLKANIEPLHLLFGNFNFEDNEKNGIHREVETIALVGDDLRLAVLVFRDLVFSDQIRPICILPFGGSRNGTDNRATVVWNWAVENSNNSEEIVYEDFCARKIRNDKKKADLAPAVKCPQSNTSVAYICMRTRPTASWKDEDTIPGLPLTYGYEESWFLEGLTLEEGEVLDGLNKNHPKKPFKRIIFEDVNPYLHDLNNIITQIR